MIIKPIDSSGGRGIEKVNITEDAAESFFENRIKQGKFVVEEIIQQDEIMAKFHLQSLNTVRLPTIVSNGEVHVFAPFIRMGVGDSVVDNAFSGGLLACIDESTGIVVTAGYDEHGKKYLKHPDTNISIIGFQIPNWDEAIKLVTKLSHIIEENRYTAWDIAYTKKGWIMVEANARGEILAQMADKIGRKQQWLDLR